MKRKAKCKICNYETEGRGFEQLNYNMSKHYIEKHIDYLNEQYKLKKQADKELRELEKKYPTLIGGIFCFRIQLLTEGTHCEFEEYSPQFTKLKEGGFAGGKV